MTDESGGFLLEVPLDASRIERHEDQSLKVVGRARDGSVASTVVRLDGNGMASAKLRFGQRPGALHVAVGPEQATDDELLAAQTLNVQVPSRAWRDEPRLRVAPLEISSWHWWWWRRWCRTIVVRGRLVCPDGRPVPGAEVCAYDVDWWFLWSSTQQVGCATTGPDGAFEIKFRWCCGVFPWWWWFRQRVWSFDASLSERVADVLAQTPAVQLGAPTSGPSLSPFTGLLGRPEVAAAPLERLDPAELEELREQLVTQLPVAPELERLHVWPWFPWFPWWDCAPDLIFRATQDCREAGTVVLDEGISETRWDVPDVLNVNLVANPRACCRPGCDEPPCEHDCLIVSEVCGHPIDQIGGNLAAPPTPAGYLLPGDNPFAGVIPVEKDPGDLVGVDYYAVEHSTDGGMTWSPLPAGASVPFKRHWMLFPGAVSGFPDFNTTPFGGHELYETREHYEANNFGDWSPVGFRFWMSTNHSLLIPVDTTKLTDGLHHFRILGFQDAGGGQFEGGKPIPLCDQQSEAHFALMVDNRVVTPVGHDAAHNCGSGVHTCTTEPDTHITQVRINGVVVGPCDTIDAKDGMLEIDFLAHDPDGHLGSFSLTSHYGISSAVDLVAAGSLSGGGGIVGPTYAQALGQGAVRPLWSGGAYTLKVDVTTAFPIPCCYLLRLEAVKRTVVGGGSAFGFSCGGDFRNVSEQTLGVGVC